MGQKMPVINRKEIRGKLWAVSVALLILVLSALAGSLLKNTEVLESFRYQFSERPFQLGMVEAVGILDPVQMSQRGERMVGINLYEGLLSFDPETLKPQVGLAAAWEVSDEARVFSFKLRKDAQFHSGRPVTAADIKYSWERNLESGINAPSIQLLLPIKGVKEKAVGKAFSVEGIEVLSDQEIRITLEQPNAGFLSSLGMPAFWVVDRQVVESEGKKFGLPGSVSAGTGPFILTEWQKNKRVVLVNNPNYWGRKPHLSKVEFIQVDSQLGLQVFREGKLDYLDEIPAKELKNILEDPATAPLIKSTRLLDNYFYQFNFQNPIWGSSPILRQALNYAVDRRTMLDRLFGGAGQPLTSLMPDGFLNQDWDQIPYTFNQQRALQLLAEAGYPSGKGLPPLELTYNELEAHQIIAEELKQQLRSVGVSVNLRPVPWKEYKANLEAGKYACFRGGWSWEYPDPDDFLFSNFHSAQIGKTNYSFYRNQEVDNLLDAARLEFKNQKRRVEYYRQAEKQVVADAPFLWLFSWQRTALVSPKVYNLETTALDLVPLHRVGLTE